MVNGTGCHGTSLSRRLNLKNSAIWFAKPSVGSPLNYRFFLLANEVQVDACGQARTALYSASRLRGIAPPSRLRRLGLAVTIAGARGEGRSWRPAAIERDFSRTHSVPRFALLRVRRFVLTRRHSRLTPGRTPAGPQVRAQGVRLASRRARVPFPVRPLRGELRSMILD